MGRMTPGAMRLIGMFGAAAALSAAGPAAAENLLRNPGFESIFSSAWSTSSMGVTPGNAHGGFYTMNAGCTGTTALTANSCSTSQVVTTVAGTVYDISFWVRNLSAVNNTTGYRATFGTTDTGTIRYTVVDAWTQYAFTAIASGTSTTFRFYGRNSQGVMAFDDFSISPVVAVIPEPATWAMMLVGFGMVAGAARYRRHGTNITYA